jgi:hypothetical protein
MDILFGDAVNDYTTRGWSIIPIRSGDKQPLIRWEEFQHRQPSRLLKNPTLDIGPASEFDYDAHDHSDGGAHAR